MPTGRIGLSFYTDVKIVSHFERKKSFWVTEIKGPRRVQVPKRDELTEHTSFTICTVHLALGWWSNRETCDG
jgi:hypothetical protein